MPTLCMFYGIIIRMYAENGGQHNRPHLHASYSGEEVAIDFEGNELVGSIPKGQMRLLLAWRVLHRAELVANW